MFDLIIFLFLNQQARNLAGKKRIVGKFLDRLYKNAVAQLRIYYIERGTGKCNACGIDKLFAYFIKEGIRYFLNT